MIRLSAALAALVDELLPGNDDWPSGSTVGVQHAIVERLAGREGDSGLEHLAHLLDGIGAPFDGMDAQARIAAVRSLESGEPARFNWLRNAAFHAYYENPAIVALIDARGTPYRRRPHVQGYDLPKFDPATQTPTHGRGHWIRTGDVRRIDISKLDLDSERTVKWGLER
ncbi:MAG: hypothetical protein H6851_13090 [Geminicoccaceae bacterium]|nr:hypothetical protein [Geminicoccaceae bacterium]MCB9944538.1 hypothetical protein [Geminicoccaceae bacterium]